MPEVTQSDPIAQQVAALEHTPAGLALAAALASLDLSSLTGSQCVDVLKARYRQGNHERGQLFAIITEVMHRQDPDTTVFEQWPGEFAADEVRAALRLTRRAADVLCDFAEDLVRRLPAVQAALVAGVIDQPRARVFSHWTACLAPEHTEAIVAALLPKAHRLTTGQLIEAIKRYAIAIDPDWAQRRYERALRGRRVVGSRDPDGTATLAGYDLPPDQVAAACQRLDRLAKAAKTAGLKDPIDHIRAELFLGMTDGSYAGLTDPQILTHLLSRLQPNPTTAPDPAQPHGTKPHGTKPDPAQPDSTEPHGAKPDGAQPNAEPHGSQPDRAQPDAESHSAKAHGTHPDRARPDAKPDDAKPHDTAEPDAEPRCAEPDAEPGGAEPDAEPGGAEPRGAETDAEPGGVEPDAGGLRLLVGLGTLVGVDSRPGELLGWGPVHASLVRMMAQAPAASWWYVLADPDGAPLDIGELRRRAAVTGRPARGYRGLQVWVQVNQTTLASLADQRLPDGWDRVIAEILAKTQTNRGARPPNGDPTARLPGAALRRWIQVRDRTCDFPGCRVPAHRADADHTVEHARGGETIDVNIGPSCRHDHRLRHEGGWTVTQTKPGCFTWTSRLGKTYHRQPPPGLDDLPEPMPNPPSTDEDDDAYDDGSTRWSTVDWRNSRCMEPTPPPPPPPAPPPPTPPPSPEDDIPPF